MLSRDREKEKRAITVLHLIVLGLAATACGLMWFVSTTAGTL